jgi:hypothetical protein
MEMDPRLMAGAPVMDHAVLVHAEREFRCGRSKRQADDRQRQHCGSKLDAAHPDTSRSARPGYPHRIHRGLRTRFGRSAFAAKLRPRLSRRRPNAATDAPIP